jgi:YVTN family beta-propeller protein
MLADWVRGAGKVQPAINTEVYSAPAASLDFEFFKTRLQPIFLEERAGHARCYACRSLPGRDFHLQALSAGQSGWSEDQSRSNFENASHQVVPGDPYSSRLLMHPLAPEAGGDAFPSGGRQFASQTDPDWLAMADWVRSTGSQAPRDPTHPEARIYVTNSAGNTINVVDPATNQVIQVIHGIELPHGGNFSLDGARVYISNESESVLDVIDRKSAEILSKVELSGRPNNIAVTKDGRRVLVGIRSDAGVVDIIDTSSLRRVKSIPVDGSVHNVYVTPDGKYAVSGAIENKATTVIDLQTEKAVWEVKFDRGVRPMAFEPNPEGSTSRIFVQLSGFNGFAVVDFAKRAEIARIALPDQPGGFGIAEEPSRHSFTRHRCRAGRKITVGQQYKRQRRLQIFATGPEARWLRGATAGSPVGTPGKWQRSRNGLHSLQTAPASISRTREPPPCRSSTQAQ